MTTDLHVLGSPDEEIGATLRLISQARRSLAEARALPDIRRVIEVASVAVDAAQRVARLAQAQHAAAEVVEAANQAANDAASVRIEAQARAGELLQELRERGERKVPGHGTSQPATSLGDLGVSRSDSSRWQQVASVPADVRQQYVDETKVERGEVSTAGLLRHAQRAVDHPAIAAESRRRMRGVHHILVALPGYRPESLVAALDQGERRALLRAVGQLPAWIEDVRHELAVHRVSDEG